VGTGRGAADRRRHRSLHPPRGRAWPPHGLDGGRCLRKPVDPRPAARGGVPIPDGLADGRPAGMDAHPLRPHPVGTLPGRTERFARGGPPQARGARVHRHDRRPVRGAIAWGIGMPTGCGGASRARSRITATRCPRASSRAAEWRRRYARR
jgi:hypothetical protein